jgi:hypothetical protein
VFAEALTETVHRLGEAKSRGLLQQYALIGVSAWGVPRATHDFDFAVAAWSSVSPPKRKSAKSFDSPLP